MSSLLTRGAAMLASAHSNLLGVPVVYRRGDTSATITATLGTTKLQTTEQDGIVVEWSSRDFIINRSALSFLSASAIPEKGDEIDLVEHGATITYVATPGPDEQIFRRSDHTGTVLRVFTKQLRRTT